MNAVKHKPQINANEIVSMPQKQNSPFYDYDYDYDWMTFFICIKRYIHDFSNCTVLEVHTL